MIALTDCNKFFASCEQSIRFELESRTIVV